MRILHTWSSIRDLFATQEETGSIEIVSATGVWSIDADVTLVDREGSPVKFPLRLVEKEE